MSRKRAIPAVTAPLEDEPLRPRRFRLRHRVLATLVLVGVLVGVRLWWGWHAGRRLAAAVAELRAKGEPVAEEDFARAPVPDERNAVFYLRRAAASIRRSKQQEQDERREDFYFLPLSLEAAVSIGKMLEDNRAPLADVRHARGQAVADWGPPPRTWVGGEWVAFLAEFNRQHDLAKLLTYGVWHAHAFGDDAEALERIADMLALSRALHRRGNETAHLVAIQIAGIAAEEAERVAKDLRLGDAPPAAARQQAKALISDLLDDRELRPGLVHAIRSERPLILLSASRYDFGRASWAPSPAGGEGALEGTPGWLNAAVTAAARPAAVAHASRRLRESQVNVAAAEMIDPAAPFPAAAFSGPRPLSDTAMFGVGYVTAELPTSDLRHVPAIHAHVMTIRTAAARALAAALFQRDHGRPPASTAELVPEYLPFPPPYQRRLPPLPVAPAPPTSRPVTAPEAT
jgi:hypothetical protein